MGVAIYKLHGAMLSITDSPPRPFRNRIQDIKIKYAREHRRKPTSTERLLWQRLRLRRFGKFRRQHPILGWIADFYCPRVRLAIEIDGTSHVGRESEDERRDRAMAAVGISVLRLSAHSVYCETSTAMANIAYALELIERRRWAS